MTSTNLRTDRSTPGGQQFGPEYQVRGYLAAVAETSIYSLPSSTSHLSPRALAVLSIVRTFRLVSANQVHRLAFAEGTHASSGRRMRRTMERLVELGLVKRLARPVGGWGGGSEGCIYQPTKGNFNAAVPHVLATTELLVRTVEAERRGQLHLIDFQPEQRVEIGHIKYTADAFIDLRVPLGRLRTWIEVDLGPERKPQLGEKMRRYCEAYKKWPNYHRDGPDKTFPRVVFTAPNPARVKFINTVVQKQTEPNLFEVVLFDEAIPYLIGE